MKKQVITLISILAISFLVGTTFNVTTVARYWPGEGHNPWDEVWNAITDLRTKANSLNASFIELQSRLDSIEEKQNQVRWIRFYEPDETMNNQQTWKDGAVFIWTPNNSTNNAILSIYCYFQYRTENPPGVFGRIILNDEFYWDATIGFYNSTSYTWSPTTAPYGTVKRGYPNQANYTIKFIFVSSATGNNVYVKDINMLIEVMDGLPITFP